MLWLLLGTQSSFVFNMAAFIVPEQFPEDVLIKESLHWRTGKCFFCESWPRTGAQKKMFAQPMETVFQAISPFSNSPFTLVQGRSQTHIQRTTKNKNDNKKTWQTPQHGATHVNHSFLTRHHSPSFSLSSEGLSLNTHYWSNGDNWSYLEITR